MFFIVRLAFYELKFWPYVEFSNEQFETATPLKTLHKI